MGRILNRFRVRRAQKQLEKGNERRASVLLAKAGVLNAPTTANQDTGITQSFPVNDKFIDSTTSAVDPAYSATSIDPISIASALNAEQLAQIQENAREAAVYELHEFDPVRLVTGQIDPNTINNFKYRPYETGSNGIYNIDKNKDLSNSRNLINLNSTKVSQIKFNQVIDIDFNEFVTLPKVDMLAAENELLKKQIDSFKTSVGNLVPDTLAVNSRLYSDRKGNQGEPAYPRIENKLLSQNRNALAIMQEDGNFVIYRGSYDSKGNQLPNTNSTPVFAKGYDNGAGNPSYFTIEHDSNTGETKLIVGGLRNGLERWTSEVLKTSETVKAVLDDNGILSVYDQTNIVWSTFGKD
jgi:hypothetical protein